MVCAVQLCIVVVDVVVVVVVGGRLATPQLDVVGFVVVVVVADAVVVGYQCYVGVLVLHVMERLW